MMAQECKDAIIKYCAESSNYEIDRLACSEFLDLWTDCAYNVMDPATGTTFGKVVTEGRGGLGTIIGECYLTTAEAFSSRCTTSGRRCSYCTSDIAAVCHYFVLL